MNFDFFLAFALIILTNIREALKTNFMSSLLWGAVYLIASHCTKWSL